MPISHRNFDPNINRQHPTIYNDGGSYSYTGATYGNHQQPSAVEPQPADIYDEAAIEAADWSIPPVEPERSCEFSGAKQTAFVEHVARTGLLREAAATLGITYQDVDRLRRTNERFEYLVTEALELYAERVQKSLSSRALYGTLEPLYDVKGNFLGHRRVYDNKLLLAEAKRTNASYHNNPKIAVQNNNNQSNNVLVVPRRENTVQEWHDEYSKFA